MATRSSSDCNQRVVKKSKTRKHKHKWLSVRCVPLAMEGAEWAEQPVGSCYDYYDDDGMIDQRIWFG